MAITNLLITSREQLPGFDAIAANSKWVRCLTLQGLEQADAMALLQAGGFTSKEPGLSALLQLYRGNPLALKTIIPLIQSIFAGNVNAFRRQNTIVVGDRLQGLLNQQFDRLSESELSIAYCSVSSVPLWYIKSILPQESKRYIKRHQKT